MRRKMEHGKIILHNKLFGLPIRTNLVHLDYLYSQKNLNCHIQALIFTVSNFGTLLIGAKMKLLRIITTLSLITLVTTVSASENKRHEDKHSDLRDVFISASNDTSNKMKDYSD